jgi:hypothetical protein
MEDFSVPLDSPILKLQSSTTSPSPRFRWRSGLPSLPRLAPRLTPNSSRVIKALKTRDSRRTREDKCKFTSGVNSEQPKKGRQQDTDDADQLLIKLRDQEGLTWQRIQTRYSASTGRECSIPALQMRLLRARRRLLA